MSCDVLEQKSMQLEELKTADDKKTSLTTLRSLIIDPCFDYLSNKISGSVRQPPANTEIVEEKKASTITEIQKQNEKKKNMKKMVEVSIYEQKRYMAHTRVIRIFTICGILVFILLMFRHLLGSYAGMPVNILLVVIMAIGAILIINEMLINTSRDNHVYDKIKYPLDYDHAMKYASGKTLWGRLKGALGFGRDLLSKPDVPNCTGSSFLGAEGEVAGGGTSGPSGPSSTSGGAGGSASGGVGTFMSGSERGSAIVNTPAWREAPAAQSCTTNSGTTGYKFSDAYVEENPGLQGCIPCTGLTSLACNDGSIKANYSTICNDHCDNLPEPSASIVSENLGEELARYLMVPGDSTPIMQSPSPVCGGGVVFGSDDNKEGKITVLIETILRTLRTTDDNNNITTMSFNEFEKVLQELLYMREGSSYVAKYSDTDGKTAKCGRSGEEYPRKLKQKYVRGILAAMKKKFPTTSTVDTNWADDFVALPSDEYTMVDGTRTENVTCYMYCDGKGKECLDAQHTNNIGASLIPGKPEESCNDGRPDAIGGNLRCQCAKYGWNPTIQIAEVVEYLTSVEGSQNTPQEPTRRCGSITSQCKTEGNEGSLQIECPKLGFSGTKTMTIDNAQKAASPTGLLYDVVVGPSEECTAGTKDWKCCNKAP